MKAALYARISTRDRHSIPMQLDAMRQYTQIRGWQIVAEVEEAESGKKNDRAGRDRILHLARSGKIDVVLVWKLNRWGRSTADLLMSLDCRRILCLKTLIKARRLFYPHIESVMVNSPHVMRKLDNL